MKKQLLASSIAVGLSLGMNIAHAEEGSDLILIQNVNVFDGVHDKLKKDHDVLVKGNLIKSVGKDISAPAGAKIIDGDGRTLTPGSYESPHNQA
ncbi:hypothetical protein AB4457_05660 [Vibrio splendidus]